MLLANQLGCFVQFEQWTEGMKDAVWCSDELSDLADKYCHQMHWEDKQSQRPDDEELGALLENRMKSVVWRVLESFKEAKLEAVIKTSGECSLVLFCTFVYLLEVYHRCLADSDVRALQAIVSSCRRTVSTRVA